MVYASDNGLEVDVSLDEHQGDVTTTVRRSPGDNPNEVQIGAPLSCLYVEARLGPAQAMTSTARSRHSLEKSLASQAAALRAVLPLLAGERRDELMARCGARAVDRYPPTWREAPS